MNKGPGDLRLLLEGDSMNEQQETLITTIPPEWLTVATAAEKAELEALKHDPRAPRFRTLVTRLAGRSRSLGASFRPNTRRGKLIDCER
jgi:hypothetical protein